MTTPARSRRGASVAERRSRGLLSPLLLWGAVALACGDSSTGASDGPTGASDGSTSASDGSTSEGDATSEGEATTSVGAVAPCERYEDPCPAGSTDPQCVRPDGASICATPCFELGPGWAPGRCELSPYQLQTVCHWVGDGAGYEAPGLCLILCAMDEECPEAGMVCAPCPEPYTGTCVGLAEYVGTGTSMCAWPDGGSAAATSGLRRGPGPA